VERAGRRGNEPGASGERKGKADSGAPSVSCPGEKVKGHGAVGGLDRQSWAEACGEKKGKEKEVSWAGPRARGPCSTGRKEKGGGPVLAGGPWCV
jgi:hypothetical protein